MGKCASSSAGSAAGLARARPSRDRCCCAGLVGLLACLSLSGGCAQHYDNRFVYVRGTIPTPLIKATEPGTYVLVPDDSLTPKFSIDLAPGDPYGFRKREDDAIIAVAKDKEIELGDRYVPYYYWRKKGEK